MLEAASFLLAILREIWWLLAFAVLWPLFQSVWLFWRQEVFKSSMQWVMLEMRIPREILKSPRAMEQVLAQFHSLRNAPGNLQETYWDGEVTRWFSLEIASLGGEIHFYIRTYAKYRDIIEAAVFSFYPDVELVESDDYVNRFPESVEEMYAQGYDMYASEMVLRTDPAYPIKTYEDFESPDEEKQYDPISATVEFLGKVKREEMIGVQFIITPAGPEWKESGAKVIEKLSEKKRPGGGGAPKAANKFRFEGGPLPIIETVKPEASKDDPVAKFLQRSPGETDVIKAVEKNLSKPAFETVIRFIYFSPKAMYYDSFARRGLVGSFNQYGDADMNSFVENKGVATMTGIWNRPYVFSQVRAQYRKQRMLYNYRKRKNPPKGFIAKLITSHFFNWNNQSKKIILTTQSLATLFHPPTKMVLTAPHLRHVDSKKAGPPAGLAIFGDEGMIDRYK